MEPIGCELAHVVASTSVENSLDDILSNEVVVPL